MRRGSKEGKQSEALDLIKKTSVKNVSQLINKLQETEKKVEALQHSIQSKEKLPGREIKKKAKGIVPDLDVRNKYLSNASLLQKSVDQGDQTKSIKKAY